MCEMLSLFAQSMPAMLSASQQNSKKPNSLQFSKSSTILDVKKAIGATKRKYDDVNRQELRLEPRGKFVKDEQTLGELGVENSGAMLYFKDRGLQIGWTTVFLTEYAGPLAVYLAIYTRPWVVYGEGAADKPYNPVAT